MNELERAGTALRERPAPATSVESIERRAGELTRRRRIGWTAIVTAVVVVAALIGVGTLRARSNDESIVVGPSPGPNESLAMALNGVPDQATADEVAAIMRDRIERMNREGAGISKDDADPRVAIDMAEIDVRASPERLTITGPDEVLARLALAPALWAPGYPSFVTAQADVGPPAAGVCPAGAHLSIGVAEPRCYEVDAESISAGIDESLAQSVPSATGGLLVPWAQGGTEDLVREVADACSRPTESGACPTGQVAIRVADGRVGVFTMPPPHPRACRHSCRRCR